MSGNNSIMVNYDPEAVAKDVLFDTLENWMKDAEEGDEFKIVRIDQSTIDALRNQ